MHRLDGRRQRHAPPQQPAGVLLDGNLLLPAVIGGFIVRVVGGTLDMLLGIF